MIEVGWSNVNGEASPVIPGLLFLTELSPLPVPIRLMVNPATPSVFIPHQAARQAEISRQRLEDAGRNLSPLLRNHAALEKDCQGQRDFKPLVAACRPKDQNSSRRRIPAAPRRRLGTPREQPAAAFGADAPRPSGRPLRSNRRADSFHLIRMNLDYASAGTGHDRESSCKDRTTFR